MIFNRMSLLRRLFPAKKTAAEVARRWSVARVRDPDLAADVARIGGVYAQDPVVFDSQGVEVDTPLCPYRMAKARGRQEFALELLALMSVGIDELREMETE